MYSDTLLKALEEIISDQLEISGQAVHGIIRDIVEMLAPHSQRLFPESKQEGLKGTLFWEYGKLLSESFDNDPTIKMMVPIMSMDAAKHLSNRMKI